MTQLLQVPEGKLSSVSACSFLSPLHSSSPGATQVSQRPLQTALSSLLAAEERVTWVQQGWAREEGGWRMSANPWAPLVDAGPVGGPSWPAGPSGSSLSLGLLPSI